MNRPTWKFNWQLILVIGVLGQSALHAQTSLTLPTTGSAGSGSTAVSLQFRLDGSIIEEGSGSSTLLDADLQADSRFIWYPAESALRVGGGSAGYDIVNDIGQYSVAMGDSSVAYGVCSFAFGSDAYAVGSYSVALGDNAFAVGNDSLAFGYGSNSTAENSTAIGGGWAMGSYSTAIGGGVVTGNYATAIGWTGAWGDYSTALGNSTTANSYDCFVVGTRNLGLSESLATPSETTWVPTDPLFEVGNGTSTSNTNSDALVVYKNGDVAAQGVITASPGGDIPMYTGN